MASGELKVGSVTLPLFGRLYRNSFKTGAGPGLNPLRQLFSRAAYYLLDHLDRRPSFGRCMLECRGEPVPLRFNVKNRQFQCLFFHQYSEGYELGVARAILALLPPTGVFYDVGSNWGIFSVVVAGQPGFRGKVYAFEPMPSSYADLQSTIDQLRLKPYVTCLPFAAGESDSEARMVRPRHSGLSRVAAQGKVAVTVRRLDGLGLPGPDLMKIDAEGFEMPVLRGAAGLIAQARPHIVFESASGVAAQSLEVFHHLEGAGYQVYLLAVEAADAASGARVRLAEWRPTGRFRKLEGFGLCPVPAPSRPLFVGYANFLAVHRTRAALVAPWVTP